MRDVYDVGIITELTQGSIINNCISEDFENCKVWGCVITPRCDLANDGKVSTFHYLPIIDFSIWVDKVLRNMLVEEHYQNLRGNINQKIENAGGGKNILDVFEQKEQILQLGSTLIKKKYSDFEKICKCYFDKDAEAEKEYLVDEKHYSKVLKDLISNGIHGYYLIESWENVNDFKIILLRDVRRMSISTRSYYEQWQNRGLENEQFLRKNDVSDATKQTDYYCILGCIKSPFMEHIMQSFSYNFTRIGIPSFDKGITQRLSSTIKSVLS